MHGQSLYVLDKADESDMIYRPWRCREKHADAHAGRGIQSERYCIAVDGRRCPDAVHPGSVATLIPQEADAFDASIRDNPSLSAARFDKAMLAASR